MFDIYAYDENGNFIEVAVSGCPADQYKAKALQLVCIEGYGSVKVVDQFDGVIVYTLGYQQTAIN